MRARIAAILVLTVASSLLVARWAAAAEPRMPRGCRALSGGPTGAPPAMGAVEYYRIDCGANVTGSFWRFGSAALARARFDQDRAATKLDRRFGSGSFQRLEQTRRRGLEILHVVVVKGAAVFEIQGAEWQRPRIERLVRQFAAGN